MLANDYDRVLDSLADTADRIAFVQPDDAARGAVLAASVAKMIWTPREPATEH